MAERTRQPLPEHVTMPLLERVIRQSLDQDYADVARRGPSGDGDLRRRSIGAGVVVLIFGLLVAVAAVQESRRAPTDATSRAQLIQQVDQRRQALASLQDRIAQQETRLLRLESDAADLTSRADSAQSRLARLGGRTGFGSVRGPGIRIQVDDSPSGLAREMVRDSDLADLVNALWAVGAEAIAINDQRLTVLSGIRNVDVAILVNGRPVSAPYVVQAIGDPRTLQSDLAESPRGQHFFALARALGLRVSPSNASSMVLPAAPEPVLRAVRGVRPPAGAAGDVQNGDTRSSTRGKS